MPVARFDSSVPRTHDPYVAAPDRYSGTGYRRVGSSGLLLPPISLGLWYNFGDNRTFDAQRAVLRYAFDNGVTHFDLANNYGPPYGAAEENFGRMVRSRLPALPRRARSSRPRRDGTCGRGRTASWARASYLLTSLDASLQRMSLEHVDIFYSHRVDPHTPLEETIGALDAAVRAGKSHYVGISSYSPERTREAAAIAADLGTPLVIHQPSYSLLNRWIEGGLTDALSDNGMGAIAFTTLAQGLLTERYLNGSAGVQRATDRPSFDDGLVTADTLARLEGLNGIAQRRGQTLAQLAIAWVLRDERVASALVGASSVEQLEENLAALDHLDFDEAELAEIDRYAVDSGVDLWRTSSDL